MSLLDRRARIPRAAASDEAPVGWIVTGYPYYGIQTDEHKKFFLAYYRKYNEYPKLGSVVGYSTIMLDRRRHQEGRSRPTPRS